MTTRTTATLLSLTALLSASLIACSSDAPIASDAGTSSASSVDGAAAGDGASADDGGTTEASATDTKPKKPVITMVMNMGEFEIDWTLNDTHLDSVDLWRKVDSAAYEKAYTLAGTATRQVDATAIVTASTYCYTVQTFRGGVASDMSVEKCGSP